jgi:CheY-like chemotaxis protein
MTRAESGPCHVLIVDDDRIQIDLIAGYLEGLKIDLRTEFALTIDAAAASISARPPDIVFLDNRIPPDIDFRNGVDVIRRAGFNGPVIVNSVTVDDPVLQSAGSLGVCRVVDKFSLREEMLRELIATYRPRAAAADREASPTA